MLSVDPPEGLLGTRFTVTGTAFVKPTLVTIFFSEEEAGQEEPRKVDVRDVELDEQGRFTLELRPTDPDEIGFWLVVAGPETECRGDVVFHIYGTPDTATDATVDRNASSAPIAHMLLLAMLGALSVGVVARAGRLQRDRTS